MVEDEYMRVSAVLNKVQDMCMKEIEVLDTASPNGRIASDALEAVIMTAIDGTFKMGKGG